MLIKNTVAIVLLVLLLIIKSEISISENKDLNEQLASSPSASTTINQNNYNNIQQSQQRGTSTASVDDRSAYERKSRV